MALTKTPIDISFSSGLDQKTDPKRVQLGSFLSLQNSVFTKAGLLAKRNGFAPLAPLSSPTSYEYLTTFNGGLTAIGQNLSAYSQGSSQWINKGSLQAASLTTLPLVRTSTNQTYSDAAVAPNGLVCTVYIDVAGSTTYKYTIADSATGQDIVAATPIVVPSGASGTINESPRVFVSGNYFIIGFGTSTGRLQFIAISASNPTAGAVTVASPDIATGYGTASTIPWDGVVFNSKLYVAYNNLGGSQQVNAVYIDQNLNVSSTVPVGTSQICTMIGLSVDTSTSYIYLAYYDLAGQTAKLASFDTSLNVRLSPLNLTAISTLTLKNITVTASNNAVSVFFEVSSTYPSGVVSNYIQRYPIAISGAGGGTGTRGTVVFLARSLGLASKAFTINSITYVLTAF